MPTTFANNFEILDEMDILLEKCLTKTYSEKLNVTITIQEIAAISSHQERARLFNKQVLPTFKEQRILILHNIF